MKKKTKIVRTEKHPVFPHFSYVVVKRKLQLSKPWWIESRRKFVHVFRNVWIFTIFKTENFQLLFLAYYTNVKSSFEKDKLRTIRVEALRFKPRPSRLLYDFFTKLQCKYNASWYKNYNSLKYRIFFITVCSVM